MKKINLFCLLIIALLMNVNLAESYIISENSGYKIANIQPFKEIISQTLKSTINFLSISQIGFVSAIEGCCEITQEGRVCANVDSSECSPDSRSSPNSCDETAWCETGWCFDPEEGYCSSGSPRSLCESDGGEWSKGIPQECNIGCCYLNENTQPTTERACQILSGNRPVNFDPTKSEGQCIFFTEVEGACLLQGDQCAYTTDRNCIETLAGDFREGVFCSALVDYTKEHHKICVEGEKDVYWADDHGNKERIAQTCASRDSTCDESSGVAICKSLTCIDSNNKKRVNGESWCEYDSYVGDGKDAPGSSHFLVECKNGEVSKPQQCGQGYREEICAEKIVDGISRAQCRVNLAPLCFGIDNEAECNNLELNPDCRWHETYIDSAFNFGICLPKYPQGFSSETQAQEFCSIATQECTMVEEKKNFLDDWDCKHSYEIEGKTVYGNCECAAPKFAEEMNNFCVSLGDCGAYPNYAGNGTNNFAIEGQNDIYWENVCKSSVRIVCGNEMEGNLAAQFVKNKCLEFGSCKNGDYYFKEERKTTWEDYLDDLDKKNIVGKNTPKFVNFPENPDPADPQSFSQIYNPNLETGDSVFDYVSYYYGIQAAVLSLIPGVGWIASAISFALSLIFKLFDWLFGTEYRTKTVKFSCLPWKAPLSASECEKCNDGDLPCTVEKCEALGTGCGILENAYIEEDPICAAIYVDDSTPPKITPGDVESGFKFTQTNNGVSITKNDGSCISEYNSINFSLKTDEAAECRYSLNPTSGFDEMSHYFKEGNSWSENHRIEGLPVYGDGNLRIYTRCSDRGANWNYNEYIVNICISPLPDEAPPVINRADPQSGSYLVKGITEKQVTFYPNEAAECRYSLSQSESFENMTRNMICNNQQADGDPHETGWYCSTTLTGLTEEENNFYVRCKDLANNTMKTSYSYTLKQTVEDLEVTITQPSSGEIIERSITSENPVYLEAITTGGMANGNANCSFRFITQGWRDNFVVTGAKTHRYSFNNLRNGEYDVEVTCRDAVGNTAVRNVDFKVEKDILPPVILNSTKSNGNLVFTTDEDASCYYRNDYCSFDIENSTTINIARSLNHILYNLDPKLDYYVTCEDIWENKGCDKFNATEKDDGKGPQIIRAYKDSGSLFLITDENARCSYSATSCDFVNENANYMEDSYTTIHEAPWDSAISYYVKCEDSWQNPKTTNECSIVVKPSELV